MIWWLHCVKRTKHTVYDVKYNFVWIPNYRKDILTKGLKKGVEELLKEITAQYEFEIDMMEVMTDHFHIFFSAA